MEKDWLSASVAAWCTAFAAVIVDFPHCLEEFRVPRRLLVSSTSACRSSTASHIRRFTRGTSCPRPGRR